MPTKMIYLPDGEEEKIWEPAREKWGGSISSLIRELLEDYVEKEENDK